MTTRSEMPDGPIFKIYDSKLHKVKVAWLSTGNSVGFEVFEFIDPPHVPKPAFEYNKSGFFHIAVTTPDIDEAVKRVVENGGRQVGETVGMGKGEQAAYVSDPWGNVVELLTCGFEALLANTG
jgi:catechol 2,3-dioxygenase-like lactoylglutathione lyase family enzyme